ncbi:MAG TPA: SLBB domain-containing protein [Syntrophorhabdaceae bacterium]
MIKRTLVVVLAPLLAFVMSGSAFAQVTEDLKRLSPEQQKAMMMDAGRSGMGMNQLDFEGLKKRRDGQGEQGKKTDRKMELERKESPPPESVFTPEKEEASFLEKHRALGKYQDISIKLKTFGSDFFKEASVKLARDRQDVPVPSDYIVGPGDEIKLLMWGRVNSDLMLTVDRNGNISIPQIGPVKVAGLTYEEMSKHLIKLSEQIVGGNIDIAMGSVKTIPIFVLGELKRPGSYTIGSFATITDALLIAGGPSDIGSMRNVQLKRKDKIIAHFDLYDLLMKGDKSKDLNLRAGDVIFVPVAGPVVGIAGNVKRPAIYELKGAHDLHTLLDLAGGIMPIAYTQQVQVERITKNENQLIIDINAKDLAKSREFQLQDFDLVKVFNITERVENAVFLQGNVKRPGKYEFKAGLTLRDVIKNEKDLLPESYLNYAVIKRMEPPSFESQVIPINLKSLFESPQYNVTLKAQDSIFVFSRWFFEDKPYIIVEGEVRGALEEAKKPSKSVSRMMDRSEGQGYSEARMEGQAEGQNEQRRSDSRNEKRRSVDTRVLLGNAELNQRTIDELRKAGITRLDDPRITDLLTRISENKQDVDQRTIDELRRMGITSLDDPRLTGIRSQIWSGTREIDQRTIDELRRLGITDLTEIRLWEPRFRKLLERPDIDQRTIDELWRSGITSLDDPRIAEMRSQSTTSRSEIDHKTIDELRRAGILSLDDPRILEIRKSTSTTMGSGGESQQREALRFDIDQRTIDELRRLGIWSLDDPRIAEMRSQSGTRVDQRKFLRIIYTPNMTVRDAVLAAGGPSKDAYLAEAELYRTDPATRVVTRSKFSIKKALEGDDRNNITLKSHDRIVIHNMSGFNYKKTVAIDGEVLRPGNYTFAKGMTVKDLIFASGNLLESAYRDEIEITRQSIEDDKYVRLEHKNINLKRALEGDPSANVALLPYDRINVKRLQDWRKERFVSVSGEVLFPGKYVTKKKERLSSLIERAGGYADDAYLRGAIFTRKRVRDMQQKALDEMISRMEKDMVSAGSSVGALSAEEVKAKEIEMQQKQKFIETLRKVQPTGRMTIYLANLRLLRGSEYDVELEEGDSLLIPTKNSVVTVAGAVMMNGSFVHSDAMRWKDYVQLAGGYSRYADTSSTFVVKVDGTAQKLDTSFITWSHYRNRWETMGFGEKKSEIEAGDTIIVPEKLDRTAWLRQFRDITQILGNIGLTAATIAVLYKTMKNN